MIVHKSHAGNSNSGVSGFAAIVISVRECFSAKRCDFQTQSLESARARLDKRARLSSIHWLVIALSLSLTGAAWYIAQSAQIARAEQHFDQQADLAVGAFTDRLRRYADVLRGTVATIVSKQGEISLEQWHRYTQSLNALDGFPDTSGLAVVRYVPADTLPEFLQDQRRSSPDYRLFSGPRGATAVASSTPVETDFHLPVTLVAPAELEAELPGFDLAAHTNRRHTLLRAAYLNEIQMTPPIKAYTTGPVALLMAAPFYKGGELPTWESRRAGFAGAIVGSVVARDLHAEAVSGDRPFVHVSVYDDGSLVIPGGEQGLSTVDTEPMFEQSRIVSLYGRQWEFRLQSSEAFRSHVATATPLLVLAGGLVIDTLLVLLFLSASKGKRNAIEFADYATRQLRQRTQALEHANEELDAFARIASHDLKSPLNGIQQLAWFIKDELEQSTDLAEAKPRVDEDLDRIQQQVARSYTMIEGMLSYSGVDARQETLETVAVSDLIHEICDTLQLDDAAILLDGEMPTLYTSRTRLSQVFANLIGNAFKYHHDPVQAKLRISALRSGDYFRFTVSDNGPGIDPKYHQRVFRAFETLQSRDLIDSSGVGLAIVKKSVELYGGEVQLSSTVGEGTTFSFDWPVHLLESRHRHSLGTTVKAA